MGGSPLGDALPCIWNGRSASDCRCGGRLPEIRTIGTRSNLDPWILPMDPVGCVFWLAVYFFYFPYWTSPSYGTTYIIFILWLPPTRRYIYFLPKCKKYIYLRVG